MNACKAAIEGLGKADYDSILTGEDVFIPTGDTKYKLTPEDVELDREVRSGLVASYEKGVTVALDTEITFELELEAIARELINKVNTMRKANDFEVTDRIEIGILKTDKLEKALAIHGDFISHEVLAVSINFQEERVGEKIDLNGEEVYMHIAKISVKA
ncbi:MAG: hypothetical protein SP4CHLAM5_10950 [Chlamydiia bacterium]|nr:hypothetical protein [Chlamydiia bacterium]